MKFLSDIYVLLLPGLAGGRICASELCFMEEIIHVAKVSKFAVSCLIIPEFAL
jgi:hypothetical protein